MDLVPKEKAGSSGVRRLSRSGDISTCPFNSIADTGRRPEALEYDDGAEDDMPL